MQLPVIGYMNITVCKKCDEQQPCNKNGICHSCYGKNLNKTSLRCKQSHTRCSSVCARMKRWSQGLVKPLHSSSETKSFLKFLCGLTDDEYLKIYGIGKA